MAEKECILKLMYQAFLEIRAATYDQDSYTCFVLSDVFHTVPLQMKQVEKGAGSYAEIIKWIQEKCEERKCTSWLNDTMLDIARLP